MIYTLLSWGAIGISAFLWGFGVLALLSRFNNYYERSLDMVLMTGLCALTVYAQFFSLFRRVNRAAFMGMILVDAILLVLIRKRIWNWFRELTSARKQFFIYRLLPVVVIGVVILEVTSGWMRHYDTYLYHAQAIHWIEEYGVVPGLGNLHFRLAYNSSFLCLQALFSLKFLVGQSLHSMNGFCTWVLLCYAVCAMKFWHKKRFFASDFLRLIIILYYASCREQISSPQTDSFVLGLITYIISKWIDLGENGEKQAAPYAYLSILGVYAVSLKLSAAMIVLLVIMPAYRLIAEKKWKEIVLYLGLGVLTIAPFLARNVIISGYLLYPYPELDLFSVDWKMKASSLVRDRDEIKAWAWGLNDVAKADAPFSEWFPVWKNNLGQKNYVIFLINMMLIPVSIGIGGVLGIRKRRWNFLHISGCMIICFVFWFLTAPLTRYGAVFLYLLPMYFIGTILEHMKYQTRAVTVMVILGTYYISPLVSVGLDMKWPYPVICSDYDLRDYDSVEIGGLYMYLPKEGDQMGYYAFPSTPYKSVLESIELRGDSFSEGFRRRAN